MKKHFYTTFFAIFFTSIVNGQYYKYLNFATPHLSRPVESGYYYFNTPNNLYPGYLYQYYKQNAPDTLNNMLLIDTHVDFLTGYSHYKYQQVYKSIPIEGAGCIEHFNQKGSLVFINAKIADSIKTASEPTFKAEYAIEQLISQINRNGELVFA